MKDPNSNKLRRLRNEDVLRRMRDGDPLTSFDSSSSWFPPRPIIDKDPKALQALYGSHPRTDRRRANRGFLGELVEIDQNSKISSKD